MAKRKVEAFGLVCTCGDPDCPVSIAKALGALWKRKDWPAEAFVEALLLGATLSLQEEGVDLPSAVAAFVARWQHVERQCAQARAVKPVRKRKARKVREVPVEDTIRAAIVEALREVAEGGAQAGMLSVEVDDEGNVRVAHVAPGGEEGEA